LKLTPILPLLAVSSLLLAACAGAWSDSTGAQESASTADGGASRCANVPSGPFQPQSIGQPFQGSEDFTFDGKGHMVGKRGNALVRINANASGTENIASLPGQVYGLRYHPNGNLIAAIPGQGKLVKVTPNGQVTDFITGLGQPNGVYVDFDGNTYVTEFSGAKVAKVAGDGTKTVLVSGTATAQGANGVVIDASKGLLFYTEYQKGKIHRLKVDGTDPTPTLVATIPGSALDGMVLDACGNVYAVDQGSSKLYRVRTDAAGAAAAAPELIASFPTNVANAQWGSGEGFDASKLYVTGNPGTVYTLDLGVGGAPVPQPVFEE
jgi:sugar lactone lactonase YvrE